MLREVATTSNVEAGDPPQSQNPAPSFLAREQTILQKEVAAHKRNEALALRALTAGKQALADAEAESNSKAEAVAQHAIEVAERVLSDARRFDADDQARLNAVNQALEWPRSSEPVGVPTLVRGEVYMETPRGIVPSLSGPIQPGDEIVVGADSYAEILAPDGTRLSLGPNTDFTYLGGENRSASELAKGLLRVVETSWLKTLNGGYMIATPFGPGAPRGTDFMVEVDKEGCTWTVFQGLVEVTPKGSSTVVSVHAGEQLRTTKDGRIEGPRAFDPRQITRWWQ